MNVIFLGLMFCEDALDEAFKYSTCGVQMQVQLFQKNLVQGLEAADAALSVVNIPPVGSFPINYRKLFLKRREWGVGNVQIGYLNLPYIKHAFQRGKLYRELKRRYVPGETNRLLLYTPYEPFLRAAVRLKKKYGDLQICLIQTDAVPGRNDAERYMTRAAKRRGDRLVRLAKDADSFVILTKYLVEPLEIGNRPYMVMECICDEGQPASERHDVSKNICLYTGSLARENGIVELAAAFAALPDAQLWICGKGGAEEEIRRLSEQNDSIRYFGFVDGKKVAELRDRCDFLINPRRPAGTYTLYSFPSKTAEYMMSGKPVIMYKLEGVPDEYDAYLNYLRGASPGEIAEELGAIFETDYRALTDKAMRGREFMLRNKNKRKQARDIVAFMKSRGKEAPP